MPTDPKTQVEELLALCGKATQGPYSTRVANNGAGDFYVERLKAENAALRTVAKAAGRFAAYAKVLEVLSREDQKLSPSNEWDDLNPILGARGQLLTLGDFRLLRDSLSRAGRAGWREEIRSRTHEAVGR